LEVKTLKVLIDLKQKKDASFHITKKMYFLNQRLAQKIKKEKYPLDTHTMKQAQEN
jgi:hypothetical protein